MNRKKIALITGIVVSSMVSATSQVQAASINWDFSVSINNTDSASGIITTNNTSVDGGYEITGITGTWNGNPITSLIPNLNYPNASLSPSGYFIFDNEFFPQTSGSTVPELDIYGLLFSSGGLEVNIYYNDNSYIEYTSDGHSQTVTFDPTQIGAAVPEPLNVLGVGLAGGLFLGLSSLLKKRKSIKE